MSYFKDLSDECNRLSEIAQEYLDQFEHEKKSGEDLTRLIWNKAWDRIYASGFTADNWWDFDDDEVLSIIDSGYVPYSKPPRNGSLKYTIGWSTTAQLANLRAFYEYFVNGGELIKFQMISDD